MKDQLLKGTMILTIAGFATRVIGFCYRIFLAGELGEVNLGIYQLIFPVYSICFTIYAAGIQTAVSQLISHQPQKNHGQIIKAGITLSLCLAVILSFSLFSFRTVIAHSFLGADKTAPLSPGCFCCLFLLLRLASGFVSYFVRSRTCHW